MKDKFNSFIIFLVLAALPLLSLAGCSDGQSAAPTSSPTYSGSSTNSLSLTGKPESTAKKPEDNSSDDNASSIPMPSDNSSEFVTPPLSRAECEQIVTLFKAWGDLDYNIHPDQTDTRRDYFPECLDTSQFIAEEITPMGSIRTYIENFYLLASGEFSTEEGFNRKLDEMFSEKFKERYKGCSSWQYFRFKDGEVYVNGFKYYDENEPQMLIYLNIESIDENTVVLNVINSAADDARGYTATLVRTENGGFKIDDVGRYDSSLYDIPWLFHHKNIQVVVNWQDNALYLLD